MSTTASLSAAMVPTLREKHAEATRRALIRSARTLFARRGYEATGVDQIAAHAGATRGADYHHFDGKRDLLVAVVDEMQAALVRQVVEASDRESDAWQRMRAGLATFLETCTQPATAKVLLVEAPAALGWDAWREIDARHFLGVTRAGIEALIAEGHLPAVDAEVLAHLLMAMWTEAALLIVREGRPAGRARVEAAVEALLAGLAKGEPSRGDAGD